MNIFYFVISRMRKLRTSKSALLNSRTAWRSLGKRMTCGYLPDSGRKIHQKSTMTNRWSNMQSVNKHQMSFLIRNESRSGHAPWDSLATHFAADRFASLYHPFVLFIANTPSANPWNFIENISHCLLWQQTGYPAWYILYMCTHLTRL